MIYQIQFYNFYNILFKYILKNSIYIYQIPYLLNIRKLIILSVKSFEKNTFDIKDNDIKKRLEFVLLSFLDSKYYLNLKKKLNLKMKQKQI